VEAVTTDAGRRTEELHATLLIDSLPGIGPATTRRLIEAHGSAVAALHALRRGAPRPRHGIMSALSDPLRSERVRVALERADSLGIRALLPGEPTYPRSLERLADPPSVVFVAGNASLAAVSGVAVVGSRKATPRARSLSRRLARAISATGTPVVSGLALGVDGEAHRGALEGVGSTVAVLGSGPDRAYPPANRALFRQIRDRGLILSEFLPGTPALRHNFPRRNRILAALARTVVVVEAGARSGALITAEHALDLGADVWVVPGPIDEHTCEGSNALLSDGAYPLVSIDRFVTEALGVADPGASTAVEPDDPERTLVLQTLDGPRSVDDVANRSGLDVGRTLSLLAQMELEGVVEREPGLRFRKAG
jgi:DNA processing protein